jgi:hypothetical protein
MANALYDLGRQGFLQGDIDYDANNIKLVLTDHGGATPNVATHDFLNDISAGTVSTSGNFATKTTTNGVADADDITLTSVSGASCESINIFKDTGVSSSSNLIAYIDTATGLPVTPNGGDIIIQWDAGANRIFKL